MLGSRSLRGRCGDTPKPYHQNPRFEYFVSVGPVARPQHKACPNRILDHIGTAFFSAVASFRGQVKWQASGDRSNGKLPGTGQMASFRGQVEWQASGDRSNGKLPGTGRMASFPNRGSEFEVRQVRSQTGSLCSVFERLNTSADCCEP
jgi:hypothetical protein